MVGSSLLERQITRRGKGSGGATVSVVSVWGAGGRCSKITNLSWKSLFGPHQLSMIDRNQSFSTIGYCEKEDKTVCLLCIRRLLLLLFRSCWWIGNHDFSFLVMLLDERTGWLFLLLLFGCNWCYRQQIVVQSSDCILFAPFLHEPHLVVLHMFWLGSWSWSMNPTKRTRRRRKARMAKPCGPCSPLL